MINQEKQIFKSTTAGDSQTFDFVAKDTGGSLFLQIDGDATSVTGIFYGKIKAENEWQPIPAFCHNDNSFKTTFDKKGLYTIPIIGMSFFKAEVATLNDEVTIIGRVILDV